MARFGGDTGITNQNIRFIHREFTYLHQLTGIWDATNPDLRPFRHSGGKLLIYQGWSDTGSSPFGTLNYYDAVRRFMGAAAARDVMALYMIPGVYHCSAGPAGAFPDEPTLAFANYLRPTMEWVETGTRPDRIDVGYFATDPANPGANPNPRLVATRPVFRYPSTARYDGSGNVNEPANWVRGAPVREVSDRLDWLGLRHYTPGHQKWFVNGPRLINHRPPTG
jgi:feruloyl esterase